LRRPCGYSWAQRAFSSRRRQLRQKALATVARCPRLPAFPHELHKGQKRVRQGPFLVAIWGRVCQRRGRIAREKRLPPRRNNFPCQGQGNDAGDAHVSSLGDIRPLPSPRNLSSCSAPTPPAQGWLHLGNRFLCTTESRLPLPRGTQALCWSVQEALLRLPGTAPSWLFSHKRPSSQRQRVNKSGSAPMWLLPHEVPKMNQGFVRKLELLPSGRGCDWRARRGFPHQTCSFASAWPAERAGEGESLEEDASLSVAPFPGRERPCDWARRTRDSRIKRLPPAPGDSSESGEPV
jgi:hypothetical protein